MQYDDEQIEAINLCCDLTKRIVAVTGEAGTGKTTIIRAVYNKLITYIDNNRAKFKKDYIESRDKYNFYAEDYIVLVAPTGKAAKRIYEATGIPAMTIHRLLEYPTPGEIDQDTGKALVASSPKRDKFNPIVQKIVLCDEYAMVNYELHRNLIDALPSGGCIRMFGDCNQLEPIEESKVLQDKPSQFQQILVRFPSVTLTKIHRQENGSTIIENSHKINKGIMPAQTPDFHMYFTTQQHLPTDYIVNLIDNDKSYYTNEKQILTVGRNSWIGTNKLNLMIQIRRFGDRIEEGYPIQRHPWDKIQNFNLFIGDKVIFTKNNYDLGVFNGESGIITDIKLYGNVTIDFGDKIVEIPMEQSLQYFGRTVVYNPQQDIDLAYVITTHKAQGSEYKEITYVLNNSLIYLCNRKNLYTAVTRAREKVNIITDQKTFVFALKNIKNPLLMKK